MVSSVGSFGAGAGYSPNLRLSGTTTAVQAREDVAAEVRTAAQSGASTKEHEQIVGRAGPPSYSEEELVANENEINDRESLKEKLRAGIADPDEELKVKAALVYPSSWPDEQKLAAARTAQANGNLDSAVQSRLNAQRPHTLREMQKLTDPSRFANVVWKKLPPGAAKPLTPEMKAELTARDAHAAQLVADANAQREANPGLYSNNVENSTMYETNVASLDESTVMSRISYITDLIQSGEAEKYSFRGGNGDETTTSIHQFLFWLQQRAKTLESDGTYSPEMFK
ncbi:hypothetical protein [Rhizobium leguminosarum]